MHRESTSGRRTGDDVTTGDDDAHLHGEWNQTPESIAEGPRRPVGRVTTHRGPPRGSVVYLTNLHGHGIEWLIQAL